MQKYFQMAPAVKVGANTWSIVHEFLKLLRIVNIQEKYGVPTHWKTP